jgi:hypothetical protein
MPKRPRSQRASKPAKAAEPATSASLAAAGVSRADQALVTRAYRKLMAKEALGREEQAALKRHEKAQEEKRRWQYYRSVPQKHWKAMSGRQTKVINEQSARYGIPFGGPVIDLPAVVRGLHDFLAENALKLAKDDDGDDLLQAPSSPALEAYRVERAALARLDRLEREGQLMPRDEARQALGRIASMIRTAGDTLQRQFGQAAGDILYEALDDAKREIDHSFGEGKEDNDGDVADDAEA